MRPFEIPNRNHYFTGKVRFRIACTFLSRISHRSFPSNHGCVVKKCLVFLHSTFPRNTKVSPSGECICIVTCIRDCRREIRVWEREIYAYILPILETFSLESPSSLPSNFHSLDVTHNVNGFQNGRTTKLGNNMRIGYKCYSM